MWKSSQKRGNGYDYESGNGYDHGIILLNNFVQDPCPGKFKIFIHTL